MADQKVPSYVFGMVLTGSTPVEAPAVPLGSWEELALTPPVWGVPPCAVHENGGCVNYKGALSGAGKAEQAHRALRAKLEAAGYRLDMDRCTTDSAGAARCNLLAHRYRAIGGRDGVTVTAALKPAPQRGENFTGFVSITAENAKPGPPTSDAIPALG